MKLFMILLSGLIFGVGLSISGMTMPSKVINFLDVFGQWDISLMFVMIGAISVYSLIFHFIKPKMVSPVYEEQFKLPTQTKIDIPLILGAVMFGTGWALTGFCPGPALTSILLLDPRVLTFIAMMSIGMYLGSFLKPLFNKSI